MLENYAYYSRPNIYLLAGLADILSENLRLEFEEHEPVSIEPFSYQGSLIPWKRSVPGPHPVTTRSKHKYDGQIFADQNYAYFQFNRLLDKSAIKGELQSLKWWLRGLAKLYIWFQSHRKNSLIASYIDLERPVFEEYLASFIQDVNRQEISNLIIDLRYNNGGIYWLGIQLIYHITNRDDLLKHKRFCYNPEFSGSISDIEKDPCYSWYKNKFGSEPPVKQLSPTPENEAPFFSILTYQESPYYIAPNRPVFNGRVIVLANQNTKSAAAWLAALLQDNELAVVVGTTTDYHPTGPTGRTLFKLPNTGLKFSLPSDYFERAMPEKGEEFQPDYWVENTVEDFYSSRDAAFEKALEIIRSP